MAVRRRAGRVSALVDTSVVVRYLTGDPPELAERAASVLEGPHTVGLTDVVLVETAYVLTSVYGVPREQVVDALVDLVQRRNLDVVGLRKDRVLRALMMCRPSRRVSFADALIWAAAGEAGRVYTFDQHFPSEDLEVLTP